MVQDIDKDDIEEEWHDIDIYPQYQISNLGNVVRKKDGLLLKQYPQKSGYVYVVLDRGEGRHYVPIHRLVCIAFHGMDGYVKGLYVDHINTIRSDNRACNLRWVTAKENANNETTKLNRKRKRKVMATIMNEKDLRNAERQVYECAVRLNGALEELSNAVSLVLGYEVVADLCSGGTEIEFRIVSDSDVVDSDSCIRMEDVISRLKKIIQVKEKE